MVECPRCAAALWPERVDRDVHNLRACVARQEHQALLNDSWPPVIDYLRLEPEAEAEFGARLSPVSRGAVPHGFDRRVCPREDRAGQCWYVHRAHDDVSTAKVLGAIAVESAFKAGQIEAIAEDVLTTPVEPIRRSCPNPFRHFGR
jgi:hypothetical protein